MYNRRFPFHHTPASGKRLDFIRIMIAIIAEKPSVGQDIARVVGATEKKGRLHSGKRLHGDMGTGTSGVTGLTGCIRLHENRRRRPSDDSRSVPSCRAAGTH